MGIYTQFSAVYWQHTQNPVNPNIFQYIFSPLTSNLSRTDTLRVESDAGLDARGPLTPSSRFSLLASVSITAASHLQHSGRTVTVSITAASHLEHGGRAATVTEGNSAGNEERTIVTDTELQVIKSGDGHPECVHNPISLPDTAPWLGKSPCSPPHLRAQH